MGFSVQPSSGLWDDEIAIPSSAAPVEEGMDNAFGVQNNPFAMAVGNTSQDSFEESYLQSGFFNSTQNAPDDWTMMGGYPGFDQDDTLSVPWGGLGMTGETQPPGLTEFVSSMFSNNMGQGDGPWGLMAQGGGGPEEWLGGNPMQGLMQDDNWDPLQLARMGYGGVSLFDTMTEPANMWSEPPGSGGAEIFNYFVDSPFGSGSQPFAQQSGWSSVQGGSGSGGSNGVNTTQMIQPPPRIPFNQRVIPQTGADFLDNSGFIPIPWGQNEFATRSDWKSTVGFIADLEKQMGFNILGFNPAI